VKSLKIAYITEASPHDKHAWSGTAHYVFEYLKKAGHQVTELGPAKPGLVGFICKAFNQISLKLFNKRFDYRHSKIYSKAFGKIFEKKLRKLDHDIVVVCGGTEYCAYLETSKPVFIIVDRTIGGALNYHAILTNLWKFSLEQSVETDKKAMLDSRKVFFASKWSADHAEKIYNLPASKVSILPFGANLDKVPSRDLALKEKDTKEWKLLLIGTSWKNKGADIAVNALNKLREKNINASLTIVGCEPPSSFKHEHVTVIPFVDKNSESGLKKMWDLYLSHHFFILPTRFEAYGIVFCEASAFGLVNFVTETGGTASPVAEGKSGFLIPHEDQGELFAEKIYGVITANKYRELQISSRNYFEEVVNWETWTRNFTQQVFDSIT
jgi:glycosyltransferase involved in cell wall biosynthesis